MLDPNLKPNDPLRYGPEPKPDALTLVLEAAGGCLFVVLALALGAAIDDAHDQAVAQHQAQVQAEIEALNHAELVAAARRAYQAGLDDGTERELFRRQQFLAAMEQLP